MFLGHPVYISPPPNLLTPTCDALNSIKTFKSSNDQSPYALSLYRNKNWPAAVALMLSNVTKLPLLNYSKSNLSVNLRFYPKFINSVQHNNCLSQAIIYFHPTRYSCGVCSATRRTTTSGWTPPRSSVELQKEFFKNLPMKPGRRASSPALSGWREDVTRRWQWRTTSPGSRLLQAGSSDLCAKLRPDIEEISPLDLVILIGFLSRNFKNIYVA